MSKFRIRKQPAEYLFIFLLLTALIAWHACGGGGSDSSTTPPPPPTEQTITLGWTPPTAYIDGTQITDLAGYILHYGQSPGNYDHSIDVGNVTSYSITLPAGTWYFSAKTYTAAGTESNYSNEIGVGL